mmetsp:Transcript_1937/g.5360  ORF Transcript_1937/g.5360 Transcript_1937/m.5360 type:complete len:167 (-) Transcript_1937:55-555(-)
MSTKWQEKAGVVECTGKGYTWAQTRREVIITINVNEGVRGRDISYDVSPTHIRIGVSSSAADSSQSSFSLCGLLFLPVKPDDCLWTLEEGDKGKVLQIELVKSSEDVVWESIVKGQDVLNPLTIEEVKKKITLEKFQGQHGGFDFSGAEFSGNAPADPKSFMKFDR